MFERKAALAPLPINSNHKILIAGLASFMLTAALLPSHAGAFWPFYTNAGAQVALAVPNSQTPTLAAAINVNPDPYKGLTDNFQTSDNALYAHSGPSGTIADVASSTPSDRISVYVVHPGDTLSEIAKMFDVSVNTIVWANNLGSAKSARVGDTLIILPVSGTERVVVKGDTLKSLAKKYSADATEIAEFNGLDPAEPLAIGSTVIIPGGEITTSVPVSHPGKAKGSLKEPYLGGSGSAQTGYYSNPIPGGLITQGIHGWNGIDIGAARGTPIRAAADGAVIIARAGGWNGGYGSYVVITHNNGTQTLYAHMSSVIASPGESVSSGQVVGYVGKTGLATGPHLHFEVRGAANPFRNCSVGTVCSPQ